MKVEILYFDGCPSHEAVMPRLRQLMDGAGVQAQVELTRVESTEAAEHERFLGSPTLRVDGQDVDPTAGQRTDFGLKCRLYAGADGLQGTIPDEFVLAALTRSRDMRPLTPATRPIWTRSLASSRARSQRVTTRPWRLRCCACSVRANQSQRRRSHGRWTERRTRLSRTSAAGRTSSATKTGGSWGSPG